MSTQSANGPVGRKLAAPATALASFSVGLACVCALAGALLLSYWEPTLDVLLVAALALVLTVPCLATAVTRSFDPFAPIVLFALAYGAMFVIRPAAIIARNDYSFGVAGTALFDFRPGFTPMLAIALIGALGFVAGYLSPIGRWSATRLPPPPRRYNPEAAVMTAVVFAAIGILSFALFLAFAGGLDALGVFLSGRSTILTQLTASTNKYVLQGQIVLVPSSLILIALGIAHRNFAALLAGGLAITALFLIAAPTGSRIVLLPTIISGAVYYYLTRRRRPRVRVVVVALILLLALATLIGTVREANHRQTVSLKDAIAQLVTRPTVIFETITHKNEAAEAPGLAAVLSLPPGAIDTWRGTSLVTDLVTRPVPRAIWSSKPDPPRQLAAKALFGRQGAIFVYRPAFSILLEPYIDAGVLGVLILMLGYGVAARTLYEYTMLNAESIVARLTFALLMPLVAAGFRDELVSVVARTIFLAAPIAIVFTTAALLARPAHRGAKTQGFGGRGPD